MHEESEEMVKLPTRPQLLAFPADGATPVAGRVHLDLRS
jgi:hypothetical protein